jgi:hypothetical protein
MQFPDTLLNLAGFALAHAAWSVSDLPQGELLVPLAVLDKGDRREIQRFEADTQEEAIRRGKETLDAVDGPVAQWAFAREGRIKNGDGYVDVISVEAKAKGQSKELMLVQPFTPPASGRFALLGAPAVVVDQVVLPEAEAAPLLDALYVGIQSHAKAAELWNEWTA